MNDVKNIFREALKNVDLTDNQLNVLVGIFMISTFKNQVEILAGFSKDNPEYIQRLVDFISREISILSDDERRIFEKASLESSAVLISEIVEKFISGLPTK